MNGREIVMRRGSYTLALALMGILVLPCSPVSAQPDSPYAPYDSGDQVDVGIFYDGLAPYGDWVEMPDYGWSWAPRVDPDGRPYTRGQWIMTDDGWFWDSDERFGWATYHYGRWINDPYYGWVWIPGTEWAPAWVSWRHGNGYTGWAPLPPRATWRTHVGLSIGGLDIDAFLGAFDYTFVHDRSFVDRGVYQRALPPTQNITIINVTNNVTNYAVVNDRVVNRGIEVANVERAVGRRVQRMRAVNVNRADAPRRARADEVAIYRPAVRAAPGRRPAQGRSLVKGEEPPPLLVERRKVRERERQQKGNAPEMTVKAVEQQRKAPRPEATIRQEAAQQQRVQAQQEVVKQRATEAQKAREQRQGARAQQNAEAQAQRAKQAQEAQQAREQAQGARQQQNAEAQARRAKQAQEAQQAREQAQGARQQQNAEAQAQRAKQAQEAQQARKQAQGARQQQNAEAQAQAEKRATDAQQAREQKQSDQQQANQQRAKAHDQQPAQAKDTPKGRGKKGPKAAPTPPPEGKK